MMIDLSHGEHEGITVNLKNQDTLRKIAWTNNHPRKSQVFTLERETLREVILEALTLFYNQHEETNEVFQTPLSQL